MNILLVDATTKRRFGQTNSGVSQESKVHLELRREEEEYKEKDKEERGGKGPLWLLYKPLGAMSPGPFLLSISHIQLKKISFKRKKNVY